MPSTRANVTATVGGNSFFAGKNRLINGDFFINQRAFTSVTADVTYGFDRWMLMKSGGTTTYTPQTFTPGTAPVVGYEGVNFARIATTGQSASGDYSILSQRIEDVRTFANQTVTVSFWAKANTGTPKVAVEFVQSFGSGGSPSADVNTYISNVTLSTSWTRYSVTGTVPSISGKTIGTTVNTSSLRLYLWTSAGSTFNARTGSIGVQNADIDIWGVQAEAGSVATPFETATGTIQGELAACQRYYQLVASGASKIICTGFAGNGTNFRGVIHMKVTMRTAPTLSATSGTNYYNCYGNNLEDAFDTVNFIELASDNAVTVGINSGISLTQGYGYFINTVNASASVALSAEL
jgi:hypothetical protein